MREFVDGMEEGTVRPKNRERYKPATVRGYDQHLRLRIAPSRLGSMKVTEVQRSDVQALVDGLLADGLSAATVNNILNPIQGFYRRAQDRGEAAHNPTERIDSPSSASQRPKRIASGAEAAQLLESLQTADRPIWATAFYAGLRRGELQALRCCDLDLSGSMIRVERSWDQYEGPIAPKSQAGRRTVPLLAVLRDYLDEHVLRTGRGGEELLFGRSATEPFVSSTIDNRAQECWEAVGLEAITLHECRHTFASLLIDAGANPKAIQTFMGHSKIQTTFDTYGHLLPGSHDEVRERMDAYLSTENNA
ncbi:MAG: tyrosine-type recombinase/integrase [Solirubrobacterales bacterium]